jgi:hypothetical protein
MNKSALLLSNLFMMSGLVCADFVEDEQISNGVEYIVCHAKLNVSNLSTVREMLEVDGYEALTPTTYVPSKRFRAGSIISLVTDEESPEVIVLSCFIIRNV